jgi:hypothetical protein
MNVIRLVRFLAVKSNDTIESLIVLYDKRKRSWTGDGDLLS